jgi:NTP pyrophosphatase (non-canonical NTP hydrolase)
MTTEAVDFNDLQAQILRTAKFDEPLYWALSLSSIAIGEEAGEIAGCVKKIFYHHHDFDKAKRAKLIEEGGDLLWYVSFLAHYLGLSLGELVDGLRHSAEYSETDRAAYTGSVRRLIASPGQVAYFLGVVLGYDFDNDDKEMVARLAEYKPLVMEQMRQVLFWLRELATLLDSSLEEMCLVNIEKLKKRYPDGWNVADSKTRADETTGGSNG